MTKPVPDALHAARVLAPWEEGVAELKHAAEELARVRTDLAQVEAHLDKAVRAFRLARQALRDGEGEA